MNRILALGLLGLILLTSNTSAQTLNGTVGAPAGAATLADSGATRTFDCAGNSVTISGSNSTFVLTGSCDFVNVTGSNDTITLSTARTLQLLGNNDTVRWTRRPHYVFIHAGTSGNTTGQAP